MRSTSATDLVVIEQFWPMNNYIMVPTLGLELPMGQTVGGQLSNILRRDKWDYSIPPDGVNGILLANGVNLIFTKVLCAICYELESS